MNLQKALDLTLDVYAGIAEPQLSNAEAVVRAAARSVVEGTAIQWCETHNRQATHRWMNTKAGSWVCDMCDQTGVMGRIVSRLLVEKPE